MLAAIATFRLSSADVSLEKSPPPPDEALRGGRRLALHGGYNRLQLQLLQRADPACGLDDAWRETERAPTPPLTVDQALQLFHLHQREAKLGWSERRRIRGGETFQQRGMRLFLLWRAEQRNEDQAGALERYRWARHR